MKKYRCPYEHPDFPGQHCNALLLVGELAGEVEMRCWRCHRSVVIDTRPVLTTAV